MLIREVYISPLPEAGLTDQDQQNVDDNSSQFTDLFTTKDKKPSGKHAFDVDYATTPAEHRLAQPRHPQTNGMAERFNMLHQTPFYRRADVETTLLNYLKLYNHYIPQHAIYSKTPILARKKWKKKRLNYSSNLFTIKRDSAPNASKRCFDQTCEPRLQ